MDSKSPKGGWFHFQMALLRLPHRGDPIYLLTGMILQAGGKVWSGLDFVGLVEQGSLWEAIHFTGESMAIQMAILRDFPSLITMHCLGW